MALATAKTSTGSDRLHVSRFRRTGFLWAGLVAFSSILFCILRWGGYLLIATDPLPTHVDAAVVLQGSTSAHIVRIGGAVHLLRAGVAERVLLAVPKQSYWGQSIPPVARRYLETNFGSNVAIRADFCEVGAEVNSTEQEARTLSACIKERGWRSVVVVTSSYHTRRAGFLWRKVLKTEDPSVSVWVYGVADPAFEPRGWWRERLYSKTWLLEVSKLVVARLF
jgi:uncharacterized SAM-binding protein YcdF (DUF218 family)